MEQDTSLLVDLVAAICVALGGGWIAARIGLSSIAGYVVAGMVISPFTPGFVGDVDRLRLLADVGVVLIMFGIGVQYSLRDLARVGPAVSAAAVAQVTAIIVVGYALGELLGWTSDEALFVGAALAISSSTVIVKLLSERGETVTAHGRVTIAWAIVQDICAVLLVAVLVAVTEEGNVAESVSLATLKAAAFVGGILVVGLRVVPWMLARVAGLGSRELFVLAISALALGTALASEEVGLSLALGAFLAGIVVSEADLSHRVLGELLPARDVFAVLFFVSVGMLIDPDVIRDNVAAMALLLVLIIAVKGALSALLARGAGERPDTAALAGGYLSQAGEFSFVLIGLGVDEDVVGLDVFSLAVAATAVSIVLTPVVVAGTGRLVRALERRPLIDAVEPRPRSRLGRYAVVCGYGDVGRTVVSALRGRFEVVVVDEDARALRPLAGAEDVRTINGDASNPAIIDQMDLENCRVLVITIPDPFATRLLVERARQLYPDLDIITRAVNEEEAERLRRSGAGEPVVADRELALEMVRHSLHRFGVDARQALAIVQRMRQR